MERLTRKMLRGYGVIEGYELNTLQGAKAVIDRLAAYEDTGLEPEEIKEAYQKGWQRAIDEIAYEEQSGTILVENPLLAEYIKLGPLDRLRELAEADREGRCVVLPCNLGDHIYRVIAGYIFKGIFFIEDAPRFGKTVFLTLEDAEAALKGD